MNRCCPFGCTSGFEALQGTGEVLTGPKDSVNLTLVSSCTSADRCHCELDCFYSLMALVPTRSCCSNVGRRGWLGGRGVVGGDVGWRCTGVHVTWLTRPVWLTRAVGGRGDWSIGWVLGQDDMVQDPTFIHHLVNKVARRNLNREGHRGFVIGGDHPDCCWSLDHLNLFPKLKADRLTLVNMEVDCVLSTTVDLSALLPVVAHRHRHSVVRVAVVHPVRGSHHNRYGRLVGVTWRCGVVPRPVAALPWHELTRQRLPSH